MAMRSKSYYEKRAREIIDSIKYLTLSTASNNGSPWKSPVWDVGDEKYNLYFGSAKKTKHTKNIRDNGKGFVVIYDSRAPEGSGEGVYMTAKVKELTTDKEVKRAIEVMFKSDPKISASQFLGKGPLRLYLVKPQKIWMNDAEKKDGLYLDYRVPVKLE